METELKAKEILEYCAMYLGDKNLKKVKNLRKEMIKEIEFMIDTD